MNALDPLLKLIGGIVLGGGGLSIVVYQVFKQLAAKWLDARFDERLQALRHQHEKEIEQLRFKISALLDRAVKLHQREYEVLPQAWAKLNDAFWYTRSFVAPLQSYPDLDRMNSAQLDDFIGRCGLLEWEKDELRHTKNKNRYYQDKIIWHKLTDAESKSRDAYTYLAKNGIFFSEDIRVRFDALHTLVWDALSEQRINREVGPAHERNDKAKLLAQGESLMKELERIIHERLWPSEGVA